MAGTDVRTEIDGHTLTLSNLDKVLYPGDGFTKAEVVDYYLNIAPVLLPHLAGRVVTRVRFPDGTDAPSFYEKNLPLGAPAWIPTFTVLTSDSLIEYPLIDTPAALVVMANYAALELHVPQWRIPADASQPFALSDARADLVMIDLDPGEGISMGDTARAALLVATELAQDGLLPQAKTTGSKGLQVQAAVTPTASSAVVDYVRGLGGRLVQAHPDLFVLTQSVAARRERILIDISQNLASRNTIAAYSLRGRARPTVSTPLSWDEVGHASAGRPLTFEAADVLDRVKRFGDLAAGLLTPDRPGLPTLKTADHLGRD